MNEDCDSGADIAASYERTVGAVPELLDVKLSLHTRANADEQLRAIEGARSAALETEALDQPTVQLLQFAICAVLRMPDAALVHAKAARLQGVSLAEALSASHIAFVMGGVPAFNTAVVAVSGAYEETT